MTFGLKCAIYHRRRWTHRSRRGLDLAVAKDDYRDGLASVYYGERLNTYRTLVYSLSYHRILSNEA